MIAIDLGKTAPSLGLFIALLCLCLSAKAEVTLDISTGNAFKAISYLDILQEGQVPTRIDGVRFETRPWTSLLLPTDNYYDLRVGLFLPHQPDLGFEVELLHDKAYYASGNDPNQVIQHFELSDGVSFLTLNAVGRSRFGVSQAFPHGRWQLLARGGVGPVIVKAASTVRGLEQGYEFSGLLTGYSVGGMGLQLGVQGRYFILPWLATGLEYKATYASPTFVVANGSGRTTLVGHHLLFGVSFGF